MTARLRSWWQKIKQHSFIATGIIIVLIALIALIAFIFAIYKFGWDWTGFNGGYSKITTTSTSHEITTATEQPLTKTLWDWLNLLGVLAIPVVVGLGTVWFTTQQGKASDAENKDSQREAALQGYIDKMSELLLANLLRKSTEDDEGREIARVRTLTVLRRLDAARKGNVLQFLQEAGLIDKGKCIIDLDRADLRGAILRSTSLEEADLSGANLEGADLRAARLSGANLTQTNLSSADLRWALLNAADLTQANLSGANLTGAILSEANLTQTNLSSADLTQVMLRGAILRSTSLEEANLSSANLEGADLRGVFLRKTNLSDAYLRKADLRGVMLSGTILRSTSPPEEADLSSANQHSVLLSGADLSEADLTQANVTTEQLEKAKSLKNATMPDGTKHS